MVKQVKQKTEKNVFSMTIHSEHVPGLLWSIMESVFLMSLLKCC